MHPTGAEKGTKRVVLLSVACLGLSAFVTQMVTLREFLNVFSGNELTLGLILGNWLLLTGLGSFLGSHAHRIRNPIRWLILAQIGIALLPAVQIVAIRMLKRLFPPGLMLGIGEAFWASFAVLLPFCLISGFLLALFSGMASARRDWRQIGDVYVLDAVGGIAGGLIFGLCLVYFFAPFEIATFLLVLNLLAALYLSHTAGRRTMKLAILAVLLTSLVLLARTDLERHTGQAMFPGLEVIHQRSTPYGNLVVGRQGKQINIYENGVPIGATQDQVAAEEIVHYALAQHPNPRRVLLVSGGLVGAHREVEKYPVGRIDYVELDPAVLELAEKIAAAGDDPRLHMIAADARRYVRSMRDAYDAILVALPDPFSAQLNRFYTVEFFSEVRRALRPDGVFSFSLSGAENYANPQVRLLASAVYQSLAAVFPNIIVIPGARQYFVASDRALGYDIATRLQSRGIDTHYVRAEYLAAKLTEDRLAAARKMVSAHADPNRDFHPGSYYAHLRYWLSQFGSGMLFPALLVGALLVLIGGLLAASPRRAVPAALCTSGCAGMGLEVVLLIAFQVSHGYVYQQVGLIITGFLVGTAAGAAWSGRSRVDPARLMLRLDALLAAAAFLLVPLLFLSRGWESSLMQTVSAVLIFPLLNGIFGFLVGAQFPPAARPGVQRLHHLLRGRPERADYAIVPMILGRMHGDAVARLAKVLDAHADAETIFVFSVDLSHYYPDAKARQLDRYTVEALMSRDRAALARAQTDGNAVVETMLVLAQRRGWEPTFRMARSSAEVSGDKSRVVGYAAVVFHQPFSLTEGEKRDLLAFARSCVDERVRNGRTPAPDRSWINRHPILRIPRAVFVTLEKEGKLRGCIGTTTPRAPLYLGVRNAAVSAAVEDPRFPPVTEDELGNLSISISVLDYPSRVYASRPEEYLDILRPGRDGVVLVHEGRRSTFLPSVWSKVADPEEFLSRLSRKQGAPANAWRSPAAVLYRYDTHTISEDAPLAHR